LKTQFSKAGLPQELVWVAEVESMLNTNAVSGSGAKGLFQFKNEAAKRFGILREPHDFRSEPDKSAKAAAQYLSHLYLQFNDWILSVAAYNAGEGCVSRLLKKHEARLYETIAGELPPQTQVYVIKVMTTLALREKTQLSSLPPPR
jgi:membrane-bound lytic murein transglycosylase D